MALQQVARVVRPARLRASFGAHFSAAPTAAVGECAEASLADHFAPRSSCSLSLARSSLGTRSESGGTPTAQKITAGERGARYKAVARRARRWQQAEERSR